MNELRPLDIAHNFCRLLVQECTGTRIELAEYLGITPRVVNTYKNKLEEIYDIHIYYNRKRCTYYVNETDKSKLPPPLFRLALNYIKNLSVVTEH